MAVIRTQKDALPSDVVPSGDAGGSTPPAVDRTKSAIQRKQATPAAARPGGPRPAVRTGAGQQAAAPSDARSLINDTMAELRRVVWPTNEEVRAGTIVTVMLLIFFSLYIFVLDYAADWIFHALGLYSRTTGTG
jgi:preprotein translocase SecE subunit